MDGFADHAGKIVSNREIEVSSFSGMVIGHRFSPRDRQHFDDVPTETGKARIEIQSHDLEKFMGTCRFYLLLYHGYS